jgi:hypothetical protein
MDGKGKDLTLREAMNETINSDDYKEADDNIVTKIGGRRKVVLGSRWGMLLELYQEAKSSIVNTKDGELWSYTDEYVNEEGKTVDDIVDEVETIKENIGSPQ